MATFDGPNASASAGPVVTISSLNEHLEKVASRKAALGIQDTPESVEAMRNKGGGRTATKRGLLRRTEERAMAAGLETIKSHY